MAKRHFEDDKHAEIYASYRPKHPEKVRQKTLSYIKEVNPKCQYTTLLDLACGSGQATTLWTDDFENIYATDISPAQIKQASAKYNRINFSTGSMESLDFPDNSIDLITIAQAIHWADCDRLYAEVQRVLKPGGVLAAFAHNNRHMSLDKDEATHCVLHEFETDHLRKGNYWDERRLLAENMYQDITFPLAGFTRVTLENTIKDWDVDHMVGLLSSYSAYQAYMKDNPDSDLLQRITNRLREIYRETKPIVTIPVILLLGHKQL